MNRSNAISILFIFGFWMAIGVAAEAARKPCYVAHDRYNPYRSIGTDGPEYADLTQGTRFMQQFEFDPAENVQRGEKIFSKLYKANGVVFGYVEQDLMVIGNQAALVSPRIKIHRKVRLANSEVYLATEQNSEKTVKIPALPRPEVDAKPLNEYQLANLFFVYKETPEYFLVGSSFAFTEETGNTAANAVKGWIHKSRCIEWNTRSALEWNWENADQRELPAVMFSAAESAERNEFSEKKTLDLIKEYAKGLRKTKADFRLISQMPETELRTSAEARLATMNLQDLQRFISDARSDNVDAVTTGTEAELRQKAQKTLKGRTVEQLKQDAAEDLFNRYQDYIHEPFVFEKGRWKFPRLHPNEPRMPLLKDLKFSENFANIPQLQSFNGYTVAATAGFQGTITDSERLQLQEKARLALAALRRLDVLLLIDSTSSMRPYMVASLGAVARLADELRNDSSVEVRFALAFYRDYSDNKKNWFTFLDYTPIPVENLKVEGTRRAFQRVVQAMTEERKNSNTTRKNTEDAIRQLLTLSQDPFFVMLDQAYRVDAIDGGNTVPESVFRAVSESLDRKRSTGDRMELAIVIGDAGDNGDSGLSRTQLAQKLIGRHQQMPTGLSVINVAGDDGHALEADFQSIAESINARFNENNDVNAPGYTQVAAWQRGETPEQTVRAIVKQVADLKLQSQSSFGGVVDIISGAFRTAVLSQTAKNMLRAQGVKVEQLRSIEGAEIFRTSIVPYEKDFVDANNPTVVIKRGSCGVRVNIMMRDLEVDQLVKALKLIVGEDIRGHQIKDGDTLRSLLVKSVEIVSGEANSKKTFSEAMESLGGLPVHSPLMRKPDEFEKLMNDKKSLDRELERLTMVRKRLEDVLVNRYSRLEWKDGKNKDGFPTRELTYSADQPFSPPPKTRSFTFSDGVYKYYWVDYEHEYP